MNLEKVISHRGSKIPVLQRLSASFPAGRTTAILGKTNSGKSLLLSLLACLKKPSSGDAFINGFSVKDSPDSVRSIIGYCPEQNVLIPELTAEEHLRLTAAIRGLGSQTQEQLNDQLKIVHLDPDQIKKRQVKRFSEGMKKKLSIAMAFLGRPSIVLLDEPTVNVDAESQKHISLAIQALRMNGSTVILTTSDMQEASNLADCIVVLHHGVFTYGGTVAFLKEKFGVGYTLNFNYDSQVLSSSSSSEVTGSLASSSTSASSSHQNCVEAVMKIVQSYIPDARFSEGKIQLPLSSASKLPDLLDHLEVQSKDLGIYGLGISQVTLEYAFQKMGSQPRVTSSSSPAPIHLQMAPLGSTNDLEEQSLLPGPVVAHKKSAQVGKALSQLMALAQNEFFFFWHHPMRTISLVLLPVVLMLSFSLPLKFINSEWYFNWQDTLFRQRFDIDRYQGLTIPYVIRSNESAAAALLIKADLLRVFQNIKGQHEFVQFPNISTLKYFIAKNEGLFSAMIFTKFSLDQKTFEINYLYNDTRTFSLIYTQNLMATGILRTLQNQSSATIFSRMQTFESDDGSRLPYQEGTILYSCMALTIGLVVSELIFTHHLMVEKSVGFKQQLYLAGASPSLYVLFSIFAGALLLAPSLAIGFALFWILDFQMTAFIYCLLLLCGFAFSISLSAFNLCVIRFLSRPEHVIWVLGLPEIILASLPLLVLFFVELVMPYDSFQRFSLSATLVLDPIPVSAFINAISDSCFVPSWLSISGLPSWRDGPELMGSVFSLLVQVFLYSGLAVILETSSNKLQKVPDEVRAPMPALPDEDVQAEEDRVLASPSAKMGGDLVVCKRVHSGKEGAGNSVHNISVGIKPNEVFVWLSPHGAGGSTMIKLLAGTNQPDAGSIIVGSSLLVGSRSAIGVKEMIGYCPKIDPLSKSLSAREHLTILYLLWIGYPISMIHRMVDVALDEWDLVKVADKPARTYSLSQKRQLSLAMTFLPGRKILFLASPSNGLDEGARDHFWRVLKGLPGAHPALTVVLSSNSVEEASNVGTKVAMLSEGFLQGFGSVEHLIEKYSRGYQLNLELEDSDDADTCDELVRLISRRANRHARFVEQNGNWRRYELGRVNSIASLFKSLERLKDQYGIANYEVSRTSLSDVFLSLIKRSDNLVESVAGDIPKATPSPGQKPAK